MTANPPTYDIVILRPCLPEPALNTPRRKFIPVFERETCLEIAVICPSHSLPAPGANTIIKTENYPFLATEKGVFPLGTARVVHKECYDNDSYPLSKHVVRHVLMPFNLREGQLAFADNNNCSLLEKLYDRFLSVRFDGLILTFCLTHIPLHTSIALPETIAGVPIFLVADPMKKALLPKLHSVDAHTKELLPDSDCDESPNDYDDALETTLKCLDSEGVCARQLFYWRHLMVAVLLEAEDVNQDVLPTSVAKCPITYIYPSDAKDGFFNERLWETLKSCDDPDVQKFADCSAYDNLQSGVMLSSGHRPAQQDGIQANSEDIDEYVSSSGVIVVNDSSGRYMTVSMSHFPFGTHLFHPRADTPRTRCVGELVRRIGRTDIGLAKLDPSEVFTNQPFENSIGEQNDLRRFKKQLARGMEAAMGTQVFINAPGTGYKRGVLGPWARIRSEAGVDSSDAEKGTVWLKTRMIYFGRAFSSFSSRMMPRIAIAGTAVWDTSGQVIGFVHGDVEDKDYLGGWIYMVPADYLMDAGYSMPNEKTKAIAMQRRSSVHVMRY